MLSIHIRFLSVGADLDHHRKVIFIVTSEVTKDLAQSVALDITVVRRVVVLKIIIVQYPMSNNRQEFHTIDVIFPNHLPLDCPLLGALLPPSIFDIHIRHLTSNDNVLDQVYSLFQ